MSSGNTYGLGTISHFGAFQRVGGKAGGFINKKFFHPSTLRNQEKLWLAMTADERERKKEEEMEKRRDEERQVEDLRKQMYLSGQGKASDLAASVQKELNAQDLSMVEKNEQKKAIDEQKRRRQMLRRDREAPKGSPPTGSPMTGDSSGEEEDDALADQHHSGERVLAHSRYEEDVYVRGHRSVWGSWYAEEEKQWGFACCRIRDFEVECPLAPEQAEEQPEKAEPRRKRRRRGGGQQDAPDEGEAEEQEPAAPQGGLQGKAAASSSSAKPDANAPLIDEKLLQAAERRKEQQKLEERKREEAKSSGYLADLLSDPTAG